MSRYEVPPQVLSLIMNFLNLEDDSAATRFSVCCRACFQERQHVYTVHGGAFPAGALRICAGTIEQFQCPDHEIFDTFLSNCIIAEIVFPNARTLNLSVGEAPPSARNNLHWGNVQEPLPLCDVPLVLSRVTFLDISYLAIPPHQRAHFMDVLRRLPNLAGVNLLLTRLDVAVIRREFPLLTINNGGSLLRRALH